MATRNPPKVTAQNRLAKFVERAVKLAEQLQGFGLETELAAFVESVATLKAGLDDLPDDVKAAKKRKPRKPQNSVLADPLISDPDPDREIKVGTVYSANVPEAPDVLIIVESIAQDGTIVARYDDGSLDGAIAKLTKDQVGRAVDF